MPLVAITRLSLRSPLFLPGFLWSATASQRQARRADGYLAGDVRRANGLVFWTRSVWRDEAAMRAFMRSGPHGKVMPRLLDWCDEASVAQWQDDSGRLPGWPEIEQRMRRDGRTSRVRHPSPAHARGETAP